MAYNHVAPTNEDGSPLYAFGRRTITVAPAFSEVSHLSTADQGFANMLIGSPTSNIKKKPVKENADDEEKPGDGIPGGSTCTKDGCRQIMKNIMNANQRLGEEAAEMTMELTDLNYEVTDVEGELEGLEEALGNLQTSNSDLDSELEQLKKHAEKLKEERLQRDKEKIDVQNKLMNTEADRQRWSRRTKEVQQALSNLLWKGKAVLDDDEGNNNSIDLGNLHVLKVDQATKLADDETINTNYVSLCRDNCLDYSDRDIMVKSRKNEIELLKKGEAAFDDESLATASFWDKSSSLSIKSGSMSKRGNGGDSNRIIGGGINVKSSLLSPISLGGLTRSRLTTTSSVLPISAVTTVHPAHKRPLTPSRSIAANTYDGTPSKISFFRGPIKSLPFKYQPKGTGVPIYNPLVCSPSLLKKYRGPPPYDDNIYDDNNADDRTTPSGQSVSTLNTNPDDISRSGISAASDITDAAEQPAYRRLDPVFYSETSRKNFARKAKLGQVRLREPPAKDGGYSRLLTSTAHPGVFAGLNKKPVKVTDIDREAWELTAKFQALGDIEKMSLSSENMPEINFEAKPKSPMSTNGSRPNSSISRLGSLSPETMSQSGRK